MEKNEITGSSVKPWQLLLFATRQAKAVICWRIVETGVLQPKTVTKENALKKSRFFLGEAAVFTAFIEIFLFHLHPRLINEVYNSTLFLTVAVIC